MIEAVLNGVDLHMKVCLCAFMIQLFDLEYIENYITNIFGMLKLNQRDLNELEVLNQ